MHGFIVEARPCPYCRIGRTARLGNISHCFNCGNKPAATMYPFTAAEMARLRSYREAVRAGFYTDNS